MIHVFCDIVVGPSNHHELWLVDRLIQCSLFISSVQRWRSASVTFTPGLKLFCPMRLVLRWVRPSPAVYESSSHSLHLSRSFSVSFAFIYLFSIIIVVVAVIFWPSVHIMPKEFKNWEVNTKLVRSSVCAFCSRQTVMQKDSVEALHQNLILWWYRKLSLEPRPSFQRSSFHTQWKILQSKNERINNIRTILIRWYYLLFQNLNLSQQ